MMESGLQMENLSRSVCNPTWKKYLFILVINVNEKNNSMLFIVLQLSEP